MRGNRFSLQHTALEADADDDQEEYWTHDWDTAGRYDLPALFDYITQATGVERIFFGSHSMGGTQFLAGMSERPEAQEKLISAMLMAPPAYWTHANEFMVAFSQVIDAVEKYYERRGTAVSAVRSSMSQL